MLKVAQVKLLYFKSFTVKEIEQIIYFNAYVVINPEIQTGLVYKQLLTENDWIALDYDSTESTSSKIEWGLKQ